MQALGVPEGLGPLLQIQCDVEYPTNLLPCQMGRIDETGCWSKLRLIGNEQLSVSDSVFDHGGPGHLNRCQCPGRVIRAYSRTTIFFGGTELGDPQELEQLLLSRRGILDAVVVGRSVPWVGEIPVAFVVAEPAARITADDLIEFVAATVPPYKKVREVVFVDELPLSPRGAVLRSALRDRLNDAHAEQSTEK
jgi:acyl-CoA synthetase (AMP-forming)/AMP-acid ligase II